MTDPSAARKIGLVLQSAELSFYDERSLHNKIFWALRQDGFDVTIEHRLSQSDRVDFFVDGVAIEVKVKGSAAQVARQLARYAEHNEVKSIVLVTTRRLHRQVPCSLNSKPIMVVVLTTL